MRGVEFADSSLEALDGADACIIVTAWPEVSDLDWRELRGRMAGRLIVDGRNFVDPEAVRAAGFISTRGSGAESGASTGDRARRPGRAPEAGTCRR
jgi:UDPglucose 6-dehydrogenase